MQETVTPLWSCRNSPGYREHPQAAASNPSAPEVQTQPHRVQVQPHRVQTQPHRVQTQPQRCRPSPAVPRVSRVPGSTEDRAPLGEPFPTRGALGTECRQGVKSAQKAPKDGGSAALNRWPGDICCRSPQVPSRAFVFSFTALSPPGRAERRGWPRTAAHTDHK